MREIRIPLMLAFFLAVLLSFVNTKAFWQAETTSASAFSVVNTASAALALTSSSPMVDTVTNGMMRIDFRKGNGVARDFLSSITGPPAVNGDHFQMRDVFRITNNSSNCQSVSVYVSGAAVSILNGIYGRSVGTSPPGTQLASAGGGQTAGRVLLGAQGSGKEQMIVDFHWLASTAATAGAFEVKVSSTYSPTCP